MDRPRVLLNCAVSQDGRLAAEDGSPVRFSDDEDLRRVHQMRADCDAILVGLGTVLADNPGLTVKQEHAEGEHPLRVVLDAHGRTPLAARVLDDEAPTLIVTGPDAPPIPGAQQVRVAATEGMLHLPDVLAALAAMGIRSLMVEGGEATLRSFIAEGAWDEFTVYRASEALGGDGPHLWNTNPEELELPFTSTPQGAGDLLTFSRG